MKMHGYIYKTHNFAHTVAKPYVSSAGLRGTMPSSLWPLPLLLPLILLLIQASGSWQQATSGRSSGIGSHSRLQNKISSHLNEKETKKIPTGSRVLHPRAHCCCC